MMVPKLSIGSLIKSGALDDLVGPAKERRDRSKRPLGCAQWGSLRCLS